MTNRAYLQLEAENKRIDAVGGALSVLHWDRAVMMPPGGADARADQMAALQLIVHEMLTAPARADLIAEARARAGALDDWQEANLREMERALVRARARPARLVEALALLLGFAEQKLQLAHLQHQHLGGRLVLGGLGLADLLRGGVAAGLRLLDHDDLRPSLLVEADQLRRLRRRRFGRPAALGQRIGERLRVVADPLDVEHGTCLQTRGSMVGAVIAARGPEF